MHFSGRTPFVAAALCTSSLMVRASLGQESPVAPAPPQVGRDDSATLRSAPASLQEAPDSSSLHYDPSIAPRIDLCACGCGVFDVGTASMLPGGPGATIWLEVDYQQQNKNWSGTSSAPAADNDDKKLSTHFVTLGFQYMFNSSWGVEAELPYDFRDFTAEVGQRRGLHGLERPGGHPPPRALHRLLRRYVHGHLHGRQAPHRRLQAERPQR